MSNYYKAIRPDGTDFYTGTVRWLPGVIPAGGWLVEHPTSNHVGRDADTYLSVSTDAADCTGMEWPCRLLLVEAVGDVVTPSAMSLPNKRAAVAWRVVAELPAHEALGPQGAEVAAIIDRAGRLTGPECQWLDAAWTARGAAHDAVTGSARHAAWVTARDAARQAASVAAHDAARYAARRSARYAASSAVLATVVRDHITPAHHDLLMRPWRVLEA